MVGIRIASDNGGFAADAGCWTVAAHLGITGSTVNFLKHRVINIRAERILYRIHVNVMTVRSELHAISDSRRNILHKRGSCSGSPISKGVADD